MVKPYQEGKVWSFRLRANGHRVYRTGFATAAAARREAERLVLQLRAAAVPEHRGPWHTPFARALQLYAQERLPFQKGAKQEAIRINRYLRLAGLHIIKLTAVDGGDQTGQCSDNNTHHWEVSFEPPEPSRRIPNSLRAHRQRQAMNASESDRLRLALATTPVAKISPYQLQQLVDARRKEGKKPATIALERALWRVFFNHARKVWRWSEPVCNPAGDDLNLPPVDNERKRVLSNKEWRELSKALQKSRNKYVAPALALLLETAMRSSESLVQARWSDLDWDRCILRLRDGKAGGREVPLGPGAIEALQILGQLQKLPDAANPKIIPITYDSLKKVWTRACERADIQGVNIHDLRHTAATRYALELNGNIPVLKLITGHKTDSQLSRYINLKPDDAVRLLHGGAPSEERAPARLGSVNELVRPRPSSLPPPATPSLPANVIPLRRRA